eukprot:Nitzschia sp. Nitz4//scaffold7_size249615//208776//209201//NITZ4_001206-RA/size249615-processed-gene-0.371-mRNA-1//-1//CDS//3329558529//369//frame0
MVQGGGLQKFVAPVNSKVKQLMQVTVKVNGSSVVYKLNDSQASKDLYAQLPMDIKVEDYGGIEKIFYPPNKLKTAGTPLVKAAKPGTLAYYAPWADVVMFYGNFGSASGLYELGHAVQGGDTIKTIRGSVRIEAESECSAP